jgi:holo-[acyl-carrier protein] synthase
MLIKAGCDLVYIERFKKIIERGDQTFLDRVFTPHELAEQGASPSSLAGVFAVKESVIKALELKPGSWLLIEVIKNIQGKPQVYVFECDQYSIISSDVSISHEYEYACAMSCFLVSKR